MHIPAAKWIGLSFLLAASQLCACSFGYQFRRLAVLPDVLKEASGLYAANGDTLWLHNDSGGSASLYAVNQSGTLLDSLDVPGAENRDWEDLAVDDQGNLFICDIGNNLNRRRDLRIYKWNRQNGQTTTIDFAYADQNAFPPPGRTWNFDAEACFWYEDSLYIFTKGHLPDENYLTKCYAIPDIAGEYIPVWRDRLNLKNRVVTAAAISPNRKRVVLLSYLYKPRKLLPKSRASVFLLENFTGNDFFGGKIRKLNIPPIGLGRQFEAIDFLDDQTLIIGAEQTKIHKPRLFLLKFK